MTEGRLRLVLRGLTVLLGALHAGAAIAHQSMNEDGIAYLDLGDAWWSGNFGEALSSAWSPLYPIVLGGGLRLARPSPEWEFAAVHLVDFALFLLALACFEFLWRELGRAGGVPEAAQTVGGAGGAADGGNPGSTSKRPGTDARFPGWVWWLVGYALFLWTALALIEVWAVTPDMLLAALLFLAGGLLLRAERTGSARAAAAFGLVLGLAYLTKSVLLPVGLAALALAAPILRRGTGGAQRLALATGLFLVVSVPLVGALTLSRDRFTFGDAGRLTYLRYVNGVPYPHWRPEAAPPGVGEPNHPALRISEDPEAYVFADPVGGTYPLGYDPAHWYEGARPHLSLADQAAALYRSAEAYFDLFAERQGGLVAAALLLVWAGGLPRQERRWDGRWALAGAAGVALLLYAPVYVEGRYAGPFLPLLWGGALSHLRLPDGDGARRLMTGAGVVAALFPLLQVAALNAEGAAGVLGLIRSPEAGSAEEPTSTLAGTRPDAVARELISLGLEPGDRVAVVGHAFDAYWARLARVRIVAEVPDHAAAAFWDARPERREALMERIFRETGARAVVAQPPPGAQGQGAAPPGWRAAGPGGHLVRFAGAPTGSGG